MAGHQNYPFRANEEDPALNVEVNLRFSSGYSSGAQFITRLGNKDEEIACRKNQKERTRGRGRWQRVRGDPD